jgi:hypothetical protein
MYSRLGRKRLYIILKHLNTQLEGQGKIMKMLSQASQKLNQVPLENETC